MAAQPYPSHVLGDVSDTCSDITSLLVGYFSSLVFTRVDIKEGFGMYVACVTSGLAGGYKRYVIAMVPAVKALAERGKLRELPWKVLQVRVLYQSYRMREQPWKLTREMGDMILRNVSRDAKSSHYRPESCMGSAQDFSGRSYEIVLLHDPKKKTQYQFNNRITLSAAVETFSMIFSILDTPFVHGSQGGGHGGTPTSHLMGDDAKHDPYVNMQLPSYSAGNPDVYSGSSSSSSSGVKNLGDSYQDSYTAPEMRGWDANVSGSVSPYKSVTSQNHKMTSSVSHPSQSWYEDSIPDPDDEIDDSYQRL